MIKDITIAKVGDVWRVSWSTEIGHASQSFDTFTQGKKFSKELKQEGSQE